MQFDWDDEKREVNLAKHGVDFEDVIDMFASIEFVEGPDPFNPKYWLRVVYYRKIVFVICWEERVPFARIISLRLANKTEIEAFEKGARKTKRRKRYSLYE